MIWILSRSTSSGAGARLRRNAAAVADEELHLFAPPSCNYALSELDQRPLISMPPEASGPVFNSHSGRRGSVRFVPGRRREAQRGGAEPGGLDETPAGEFHGIPPWSRFQWVGFFGASGC